MALSFLNPSRSYDEENRRVRFIGYDGMRSVPFAIEIGALRAKGLSLLDGEAESLAAFDASLGAIHDVAREVYKSNPQTTYLLRAADFE